MANYPEWIKQNVFQEKKKEKKLAFKGKITASLDVRVTDKKMWSQESSLSHYFSSLESS